MTRRFLFQLLLTAQVLTLPWRPDVDQACVWREQMSSLAQQIVSTPLGECTEWTASKHMENI